MTPDDLFVDPPFVGGWPSEPPELRTELLERLRRGAVDGVDDLDVAQALGELLRSDFMAYGTAGGERLTDHEVRIALRAWRATLSRLGVTVDIGWQDFTSFRSYWLANDGHRSWAARRHMVGEAFEPVMARIYSQQERAPVGTVVEPALSALSDAGVIKEHLRRMEASVDADPRLAVSVAKDLVESTAKLVLVERAVAFTRTDDLPALVARAQ